ncbi:DNA polymerase III subunit gamma/tau [bacterium]|nr:DNA polymerase III subunit gamma/tau [bacterium]
MNTANLNLARKWRSRNFDQIVGQELSIRMLKNSLYLNQYFPVYLFSGQRGCGKTTTARVFAAAINCEQLDGFRKKPKISPVPCLECSSCKAMLGGKHPDFIEIDAASHTGVDNVRQIIDASQLLPLMGNKKIYLIDEAHMLSKAAFNAFLKILEEPPSSVLFILATTDPQKIIDTVKSRCFRLFFKSVAHTPLLGHLKNVCNTEKIAYEDAALDLIIKETEGSVRDALNVVEQVRFARGRVTKDAVLHVLGHIDDERMLKFFEILIQGSSKELLQFLQMIRFDLFSAEFMWNKLIEILRAALWVSNGVTPEWFSHYVDALKKVLHGCSVSRLNSILMLFYSYENLFLKTTAKHSLLEMIFLQVTQKNAGTSNDSGSSPASCNAASPVIQEENSLDDDIDEDVQEEEIEEEGSSSQWKAFLSSLDALKEPLLSSIFKNGTAVTFDKERAALAVTFAKQFAFFQETLNEMKKLWFPLLQNSFAQNVTFDPQFTGQQKKIEPKIEKITKPDVKISASNSTTQKCFSRPTKRTQKFQSYTTLVAGKTIDITDSDVWKKATMIARYFSGTFSEINEA